MLTPLRATAARLFVVVFPLGVMAFIVATDLGRPPPPPSAFAPLKTGPAGAAPQGLQQVEHLAPSFPGQVGKAEWSDVEATWGCFFFSGPPGVNSASTFGERLGMIQRGHWRMMSFGGEGFGGARRGETVELRRTQTRGYQGGWVFDEILSGTLVGQQFEGTYAYSECPVDEPGLCRTEKVSDCTISADLRVEFLPSS